MCTVSWSSGATSGGLIFNRDEQRSRSKARPPRAFFHNGVRVIAPIDKEGGGTWIAVNEYGFCAALLNNYGAEARNAVVEDPLRSRGLVPLEFMDCHRVSDAVEAWDGFEKSAYRPFLVLFWDRAESIRLFSWDGASDCEVEMDFPLVTTSSFRTDEVEEYRRGLFRIRTLEFGQDRLDRLKIFHFDESHREGAFNPLMTREDALTHSVSQIRFEDDEIVFKYWDRDFENGKLAAPLEERMVLRLDL